MLIWITAPAAAIGVLLVLLSVVPSKGIPLVDLVDSESLRISDLPFANSILNPCSPGTSRNSDRDRPKAEPHVYSIAFYKYMAVSSTFYKQVAQRVANEEADVEEALKRIHSSLLMHAAYAYFVDHQFATVSGICSETSIDRERNLAREALILAKKQKQMACMTQMTMEELGFTLNVTNKLLNERFSDLRLCSRRALRDCQVMLSISHLLDVIGKYSKSMVESMEIN